MKELLSSIPAEYLMLIQRIVMLAIVILAGAIYYIFPAVIILTKKKFTLTKIRIMTCINAVISLAAVIALSVFIPFENVQLLTRIMMCAVVGVFISLLTYNLLCQKSWENTKPRFDLKIIVFIGLLSAIATILMFFPHFPLFPGTPASFLDVDFSDVPAFVAAVMINPFAGVLVVLAKNLIHVIFSETFAVGEISNLILGTVYSVAVGTLSYFTFRKTDMKKKLLFVLPVSVVIVTVTAMLSNYFLVLPAYDFIMHWGVGNEMYKFIIIWILPFNLVKSTLQAVVFYLLYRGLAPHLKKRLFK